MPAAGLTFEWTAISDGRGSLSSSRESDTRQLLPFHTALFAYLYTPCFIPKIPGGRGNRRIPNCR